LLRGEDIAWHGRYRREVTRHLARTQLLQAAAAQIEQVTNQPAHLVR